MHIDSKEKMVGIPILEVRKLFRYVGLGEFGMEYARETLKITDEKSDEFLMELLARGLIENVATEGYYKVTMLGSSFRNASAANPVKRQTADKLISQVLKRVTEVNANPYYLCKVMKVIVFGSYLTNAEKINDVDIALDLIPKEADLDTHLRLKSERVYELKTQGKRFRNMLEEIIWDQEEVMKYLKGRSRGLSLHDAHDGILETAEKKIIFSQE